MPTYSNRPTGIDTIVNEAEKLASRWVSRVRVAGWSVRRLEAREHREVAHVGRQQIGLEKERRGGDEVVGIVDPAVGTAVLARHLPCCSSHVFTDRDPRDRREEPLERREFVVSYSGDQLEPNDLARREG